MLSKSSFQLIDTIARTGSFSAAAKELHKVPSAISHTVKQLELELGVTLFQRHHRSITLTPAGRHFTEEARNMLIKMERIKQETQRVANGWQPALSIAIDVIVCTDRINEMIADFYHNFNNVELIIRMEVFNGVWESLGSGRSDIAIGATTAVPISGNFQYTDMGSINWAFVVGKNHPLAVTEHKLQASELSVYPSICLEDSSREIIQRTTWLLANQRRLVVPGWQQAIKCAALNLGIGYIPKHLIRTYLESGELIEKHLIDTKQPSPCCLAWRTDNKSPALQWTLSYLGNSEKLHREWIQ